ncbi:MAG: hypothetical protein ACTSSA_12170 [Candidatus Freyarchaeota archaeon]
MKDHSDMQLTMQDSGASTNNSSSTAVPFLSRPSPRSLETYEEVYGKLKVIPVSFREDVYENDEAPLDLYPTGGTGRFDMRFTKTAK